MAAVFTEKLKLTKRDTGDLNWGVGHNANLDLLDVHAQQATLRPSRTLFATLGSGAVGVELSGNTTYFYKVTAINTAGETTENKIPAIVEAQVSQPVTPLPIILQWDLVKGASGYRIYKSSTTGQERFLVEVSGESTLNYTDTGNVATNNSLPVPSQNTARTSVRKIVAGAGITVSPPDGTGDVTIEAAATGGVSSIRKNGEASGLSGDVKLEAGTNISLTQDAPNNKVVIAATGGGVTAYQTQVVAAPTGVAVTDTANIQNALSAAGTAGGGIVQLREGQYVINNTLTIPARVTLQGQGRDATTILCDSTMGAVNTIATSGNSQGLRDLKIDENQPGRAGGSPFVGIFMNGTNALVENCQFVRNKSQGSFIFLSTGGQMRNCIITNNGGPLSTAMVQGGDLIDSCTLTQAQSGNVNDFMQQPGQVVNCRLLRSQGTMSGAGIRASTSNKIVIGNGIFVGSGNNAIIIGGSAGTYIGNICQGGNIRLESGAGANTVIGNAMAVIVDVSGQSNQIANNT